MRVARLETFTVSVPYTHTEVSFRVQRGGVTDVLVKLTADNGLVGWGESCSGANAASVEEAVKAANDFVVGRDPWHSEAIARDYFSRGLWDFRPMTASFAFAGIDQALWDLCGKECGQPLYRLLGGALRDEVDYFYYMAQGPQDSIERQCLDGVSRGYRVFYLKVGIDAVAEERMLETIRGAIGPDRKIRIDANEAWRVPEAVRLLSRWDAAFDIDFAEAPVPVSPIANMQEVRAKVATAICANEGLGRPHDVLSVIRGRGADVLCFSSYWVGSVQRLMTLGRLADLDGISVCKHTHGELGIAAAAGQHAMLALPSVVDGCQQTAAVMEDDVLVEPVPITAGPRWGRIERPGLGIEIDEDKVARYHELYLSRGQFLPYGDAGARE